MTSTNTNTTGQKANTIILGFWSSTSYNKVKSGYLFSVILTSLVKSSEHYTILLGYQIVTFTKYVLDIISRFGLMVIFGLLVRPSDPVSGIYH